MRALILIAAVALAACQPMTPVQTQPPPTDEPSVVVSVGRTGQAARDILHEVAVGCWLDGVVRGANLIIKPTGNLIIVSDTDTLVAADFIGNRSGRSRWRLSGQSVADPIKQARLVETLDLAVRTGQTDCPILYN